MRFSIEVQNEPKMFFHVLPAAEKATGLNRQTIRNVLERGNKVYHRQSDHKLFNISKEDPILIAKIEGEDFFSLEEIHEKFDLTPTRFLNQVKNKKFAKKIDWISDELFPEKAKQVETEKPDEIKILREEMKSQFEKLRGEMAKFQEEIDRLSAKVETLEASLEKEKASRPAEVSPKPEAQEEKPIFKMRPLHVADFTLKSLGEIIRNGIVGKIQADGPKTRKNVLVDNKREYLPDLVKQIIQDHILPEMGDVNDENSKRNLETIINDSALRKGVNLAQIAINRGKIRRLEPTFIMEISKEVMKLI